MIKSFLQSEIVAEEHARKSKTLFRYPLIRPDNILLLKKKLYDLTFKLFHYGIY